MQGTFSTSFTRVLQRQLSAYPSLTHVSEGRRSEKYELLKMKLTGRK